MALGAHGLDLADLSQRSRYELLPAKAGVDRHDEHKVNVLDDRVKDRDGGARVDCHARLGALLANEVGEAVGVRGSLVVEGHDIRPGRQVLRNHLVGIRNHEMGVDRRLGGRLHGSQNTRAKGEVGHEVSIHGIEVNIARAVDGAELVREVPQVSREDGGCDLDFIL
jgi:hypothetical protein